MSHIYIRMTYSLFSAKGRQILEDTKHLVEKLQYEVIYGDTDSLMINTNILEYDDVFSIGRKVWKMYHQFIILKVILDYTGLINIF